MKCSFCDEEEKFKRLDIAEYKYWKIQLHSNQYYLGRCMVILKRHLGDLFEINGEEREELFEIGSKLEKALVNGFGADIVNYASLGNEDKHLHIHFVPRYS